MSKPLRIADIDDYNTALANIVESSILSIIENDIEATKNTFIRNNATHERYISMFKKVSDKLQEATMAFYTSPGISSQVKYLADFLDGFSHGTAVLSGYTPDNSQDEAHKDHERTETKALGLDKPNIVI
jgi:hypothetical protein